MFSVDKIHENIRKNNYLIQQCQFNSLDYQKDSHIAMVARVAKAAFEIADYEARKGIMSIKWDNNSTIPEDLKILVKEATSESSYQFNVVKAYFKTLFDINADIQVSYPIGVRNFSIALSWKPDNPFLNPKPIFNVGSSEIENNRKSYFDSLFNDPVLSDIQINIEGNVIPAHKIILAQCPYFKALLTGEWKENEKGIIDFKECGYSTFLNFLSYLYKQKVTDGYFQDINNCLDMLHFADRVNFQPLKDLSKSHIYQLINEENFLQVQISQLELNDQDLGKLCKWFLQKHPTFGESLDLSPLEIMHVVNAYEVGKSNNVETLVKVSLEELKKKVALDNDFIKLCQHIKDKKDTQLKNAFIAAFKENPQLYTDMENGKKDRFKPHWKAYSALMRDITL